MTTVRLPDRAGVVAEYELGTHEVPTIDGMTPNRPPRSRIVYAAAHIVNDPFGDPVGTSAVDWDATLAFRHHLWSTGFGVAEAMDTAQRGMGLAPGDVFTLIDRSLADAAAVGGAVACGITTDDLPTAPTTLDVIVASYLEQLAFVEERGGTAVVMASRALAASAVGPDSYLQVYDKVLTEAGRPVVLHWLGASFDPALAGYWGSDDPVVAMETLLDLVDAHQNRIDGVKVSLLDERIEIALRRRLPAGVRCYTGDDFNYPDLIAGDDQGYSDALLGVFDAIAPVAITALHALDAGDLDTYHRILAPTVALSRRIFETPTYHYKTGLVFLAYLTGHQDHFRMVGGYEGARSVIHLADIVRLADASGLLPDSALVAHRLRPVMAAAGVV